MLKEWTEESENKEIQNKLEYLKEFFNKRYNLDNPLEYTILEYFPKNKDNYLKYRSNSYKLYNITLEVENDGVVYFNDYKNVLSTAMYSNSPLPLQAIMIDKIVYIGLQERENKITITLNNGYIQIKY